MTTTAYPLDNTEYYAEDARLFHIGRSAGVFNVTGSDFRVTVTHSTNRTVAVAPGYAYLFTCATDANAKLGGIVFASTEITTFTVTENASNKYRYDYIAIRYDSIENTCKLVYVEGTNEMPTPQRTATRYELIVCVIHSNLTSNGGLLLSYNLTDTRLNEEYCGVVVDTCAKIDTDAMYNQFQSFMTDLKEEIDSDTEMQLSERIKTNASDIDALEARQEIKYKIGTEAPTTTNCPDGYFYFRVRE